MRPIRLAVYEETGVWFACYTQGTRIFKAGTYNTKEQAVEACFYHFEVRRHKINAARGRRAPAERPATPRRGTMTESVRHKQAPRANERRLGCRGVVKEGGGYVVRFQSSGVKYNFGWFPTLEEAAREYDHQILRIRGVTAITNGSIQNILMEQGVI